MDRRTADRIIVKSNARMMMVLKWYYENREYLDRQEWHAPMDAGVIELQEECIEFTFESKGSIVEISMYSIEKPDLPAIMAFDYDPFKGETGLIKVDSRLTGERKKHLYMIVSQDKTNLKLALKYHTLMLFMTYYSETVTVTEKGRRTKREAKTLRKDISKPLPLIRKQYVIEDVEKKKLKLSSEKRAYKKPDHEVNVRGHVRHYKSGKAVWIKPSTRYKGKNKQKKEYEL